MLTQTSNQLNSFIFSTPEMSQVFSTQAQLRAMARFEWALTCALEKCGLAAGGSGNLLKSLLQAEFIEIESLVSEGKLSGNIAIPFVRQLTAVVKSQNEPAARSIHLGATSQDVLDTALVLQIRDALTLLNRGIDNLTDVVARQVKKHAGTLLAGRTWLQIGPPTTLGLKLAGTLTALRRTGSRLQQSASRLLVLQFGGAVGTRSALGKHGPQVAAELAQLLELRDPEMPWHTERDNLAEVVQVLSLLTGSLAKFARDIVLLMQSEVAEVSEGGNADRGGSSTMPHKHNPVACAAVIAIHFTMPGLAGTMLSAMPQEHERAVGLWQAEWETIPEAFRRTAAALGYALDIAEHLQVDAAKMQANLDATLGLPMAEAVSVALTRTIGKSKSHDLLRLATDRVLRERRPLAEVLGLMPEVTAHLSAAEIDQLLDPRNYLGSVDQFIGQVLEEDNAYS